jgi:hypothetical protein
MAPTYQNIRSQTHNSQRQKIFKTTLVNNQKLKLIQSPQSSPKQKYSPQSHHSPQPAVPIPSYNSSIQPSVHPPRYQVSQLPNFLVTGTQPVALASILKVPHDNYNFATTTSHNEKTLTLKVITELHLNESVENKYVQEGSKIPENLIGKLYSSQTKPPSILFEHVDQEHYEQKQDNLILENSSPYKPSLHLRNKAKKSLRFEKVS